MRRLTKLTAAAAVTAVAAQLLRRYLQGGPEPFVGGDEERTPDAETRSPATDSNGDQPTREQLYREAQEIGVEGRSKMNKQQLQEAVEAAKTGGSA